MSNIDQVLYNKWKQISKRRSKRKYQDSYVDSGRHQIAQNKYENKFKQRISQNSWGKWKYENEEERKSYLLMKRHKQSKYQNREKIMNHEHDGEKRLSDFYKMCETCLHCLDCDGEVPLAQQINKFHLVEGDFLDEHDEVHSWLKDVDSDMLEMIITFQKVALVPESRWKRVVEKIELNSDMQNLKDKLYRLIGRLKAYEYRNTNDITIPDEYKVERRVIKRRFAIAEVGLPFSKENVLHLCTLIRYILGEDIADLFTALKINEKDMKNLRIACTYAETTRKVLRTVTFKDFEILKKNPYFEHHILVIVTFIGPIKVGPDGNYQSIHLKDLNGETGLLILNVKFLNRADFLKTFKLKRIEKQKLNTEDDEEIKYKFAQLNSNTMIRTDDYETFGQVQLGHRRQESTVEMISSLKVWISCHLTNEVDYSIKILTDNNDGDNILVAYKKSLDDHFDISGLCEEEIREGLENLLAEKPIIIDYDVSRNDESELHVVRIKL